MNILQSVPYFHRNLKNDFDWHAHSKQLAVRVFKVAIPFFSLIKPLAQPLSLGLGSLRVFQNSTNTIAALSQKEDTFHKFYHLSHTIVAVISVAAAIFSHPMSSALTTLQDLSLSLEDLISIIRKLLNNEIEGKLAYQKLFDRSIKIAGSLCYLALSVQGGGAANILFLSLQILSSIYDSRKEYLKGNLLEAAGHLAMSLIHANHLAAALRDTEPTCEMEDLEEIESTGDIRSDIKVHLKDILTESEQFHLIDKLNSSAVLNPSSILTFAQMRGAEKSFSTLQVRKICSVMNKHNTLWGKSYRSSSFWESLHRATFNNVENELPTHDANINYEMRRLNWRLQNKLLSVDEVETFLSKESFLERKPSFDSLKNSIWEILTSKHYSSTPLFPEETWKENYDTMYQTKSYQRELSAWSFPNPQQIIDLSKKYPKNTRLILNKSQLFSHHLMQIVDVHKNYIIDFEAVPIGHDYYDGANDYTGVHDYVLENLSHCPNLKRVCVGINPSYNNYFGEPYVKAIIKNCPIQSLYIMNPYWANLDQHDSFFDGNKVQGKHVITYEYVAPTPV